MELISTVSCLESRSSSHLGTFPLLSGSLLPTVIDSPLTPHDTFFIGVRHNLLNLL